MRNIILDICIDIPDVGIRALSARILAKLRKGYPTGLRIRRIHCFKITSIANESDAKANGEGIFGKAGDAVKPDVKQAIDTGASALSTYK